MSRPVDQVRNPFGWVALALFVATIPLANWTLERYGFVDVPWLGPVASGVVWIGAAFVLRDVAQLALGKWLVWLGIVVGAVLAWWIASPSLATASVASFAISEAIDWCVYTPLADRRFTLAVLLSSWVGAGIDSALFLWLAFDSTHGWWQLAVAKSLIVALVAPLAWGVRRAVPRYDLRAEGA